MGWDSRKARMCLGEQHQLDERNTLHELEKQEQRSQLMEEAPDCGKNGALELRRHKGIGDGHNSMHDGVDSAEIGVATGSQPGK